MNDRPAGITALAVLNFTLAALGAISYASLLRLLRDHGAVAEELSAGRVYAVLAAGLACSLLLVVSGVGYLRRHRLWGRAMGNAYALLAFATSVAVLAFLPRGFGFATVTGLVYPPLTLALLNLRFRAAFAGH